MNILCKIFGHIMDDKVCKIESSCIRWCCDYTNKPPIIEIRKRWVTVGDSRVRIHPSNKRVSNNEKDKFMEGGLW